MLAKLAVTLLALGLVAGSQATPAPVGTPAQAQVTDQADRYTLDAAASRFIAHAHRGGLLWFKGTDHLVAAQDFSGEVRINPTSIMPASLRLVVKSASMHETSDKFTDDQKHTIDKELREIVLLPAQYPDIVFQSTDVQATPRRGGEYDLRIGGDLTLLGVTHHIVIPARLAVEGDDLRASGEFSIDRSDYKVKATSAFHGLVRVRHAVDFTFDIAGHRR
jgi:polyisoprenoid-binding protein YceI